MAYPIESKLVVAVASSALFDLSDSDKVYRQKPVPPIDPSLTLLKVYGI